MVIFNSIIDEELSLGNLLLVILASVILGLIVSLCYMFTHKKTGWSQSLVGAYILLPAVISAVIMLVGSNVAKAFSVAGVVTIIRFRSAPGDVKDLCYILFTIVIGLACGEGFIAYAAVFTIILCLVMICIELSGFGTPKMNDMVLRITIPEALSFEGSFDEILAKYTTSYKTKKLRTTDYGSLYEIVYEVTVKKDISQKKFIDEIRTRNGNMPVTLTVKALEEQTQM